MKDLRTMVEELRNAALELDQRAADLIDEAARYEHEAGRLRQAADLLAGDVPAQAQDEPADALTDIMGDGPPSPLTFTESPRSPVSDNLDAPFGYKPDGTPWAPYGHSAKHKRIKRSAGRKLGGRNSPEAYKRMTATRKAKQQGPPPGPRPKASEARLRVLSSTAPTAKELQDREVAHVTQEPA